jgi:predicted TIM-barrel fold metal-dependent hydrolase
MSWPIIDSHHHIWQVDRTPWLAGPPAPRIFGRYDAIRRDYLIEDYAADAGPHGVTGSVHVQANVAPGGELDEAEWATASGTRAGLAQAVVAFADLSAPDISAALGRLAAAPALRGIRQ